MPGRGVGEHPPNVKQTLHHSIIFHPASLHRKVHVDALFQASSAFAAFAAGQEWAGCRLMALALFLRLIAIQGPLLMQKAPVALFCRRRAWCSRRKWKGASKVSQGDAIRGFGLFGDNLDPAKYSRKMGHGPIRTGTCTHFRGTLRLQVHIIMVSFGLS